MSTLIQLMIARVHKEKKSKVKKSKAVIEEQIATEPDKNNPVADMDADSIQQDPVLDEGTDPSPCAKVERHYATNVLNRPVVGSNDLKAIYDTCNLYPTDFIIETVDQTVKANIERNGECRIKSFKYFIPILQEEWEKRQIKNQPVKPVENRSYKKNYQRNKNSSRLDMDHNYDIDAIEKQLLKRSRGG